MTTTPVPPPHLTPAMKTDLIDILTTESKAALVLCPNVSAARWSMFDLTSALMDADLGYEARWSRGHERVYDRQLGSWVAFRSVHSNDRAFRVDLVAMAGFDTDARQAFEVQHFEVAVGADGLPPALRPGGQIRWYGR